MKPEGHLFWKCLRGRSSAITTSASIACVSYPKDEWVTPYIPGSKLFVFESESDAKRFAGWHSGLVYVPCLVKNPVPMESAGALNSGLVADIRNFWNGEGTGSKHTAPPGTFVCDAVKCLD